MDFNSTRFTNFAKYDFITNKSFYTSLAIITFIITQSIAFLSFTGRYSVWKTFETSGEFADVTSPMHYSYSTQTVTYICAFLTFAMCIFGGCWAHSMKEKQGRITELTLPATNLEKFAWHISLMTIGGSAVCLASFLTADLLNFLLTLCFIGTDAVFNSLIIDSFKIFILGDSLSNIFSFTVSGEDMISAAIQTIFRAFTIFNITATVLNVAIYIIGNAFKYKFNVIITFILQQLLTFLIVIILLIGFTVFIGYTSEYGTFMEIEEFFEDENSIYYITVPLYIGSVINLLLSAGLVVWSYKRYTKAQITTTMNK